MLFEDAFLFYFSCFLDVLHIGFLFKTCMFKFQVIRILCNSLQKVDYEFRGERIRRLPCLAIINQNVEQKRPFGCSMKM